MMKKIMLLLMLQFCIAMVSFSQTTKKVEENPNADHDRMVLLMQKSEQIELPIEVIDAFKKHAALKGYDEKSVLRSAVIVKPLYNKAISKEDKLFVCSIIKRMTESQYSAIPASVEEKIYKELTTN
ncbi:MAG: hypothetical protein HOO89_11005 [Ferruginibacter sp.]|nr:hypothetical protein [Ferruginibacter sp.]